MFFRGISQLQRISGLPGLIYSRLNGYSGPCLWNLERGTLSPLSNYVRKPSYISGRLFRTCSCFFSTSDKEVRRVMNELSDRFGEAMELLGDARSSMGTVYFSDDMTDAEVMVDKICKDYEKLLSSLPSCQSKEVTRAIGLKMEELKAQLQLLKESIKE